MSRNGRSAVGRRSRNRWKREENRDRVPRDGARGFVGMWGRRPSRGWCVKPEGPDPPGAGPPLRVQKSPHRGKHRRPMEGASLLSCAT